MNGDEITFDDRGPPLSSPRTGKNPSYELLKINLLASRGDGFHVDTLDLYSARQRMVFVKQAAIELGVKEDAVKHDLGRVLLKLEELQHAAIKSALEPKKVELAMNDATAKTRSICLRDPKLLDRILEDFHKCGMVGEENNRLVVIWPRFRGISIRRWPWWCNRAPPPANLR